MTDSIQLSQRFELEVWDGIAWRYRATAPTRDSFPKFPGTRVIHVNYANSVETQRFCDAKECKLHPSKCKCPKS